jgi:hypothetical protein
MPQVNIKADFQLMLSPAEMRLVRKALSGRLTDEDIAEAKALEMAIAKLQASSTDEYLKQNQKFMENIGKAEKGGKNV